MSSNKLYVSKPNSQKLDLLSNRLNLRPNIICRLALGKSLAIPSSIREYNFENSVGREFTRFTLTGENNELFKVLIFQHEYESSGKIISENQYFSVFFRKHLERGIELLYEDYQKINSPINFLLNLV